jgi:transposase
MGRRSTLLDPRLARTAREALESLPKAKLGRKLQALAACIDHPISTVCEILRVSRQSLHNWAENLRQLGPEGLDTEAGARPRGHRRSKLSEEQKARIARWMETASDDQGRPVHWTIERMRHEVKERFGVELAKTPMHRTMRQLGFGLKVPSPAHAKSQPKEVRAFKKRRAPR